ncbi:hypothetical protein L208DRAFT_1383026 [Tricholoma matsutake]|nr:hypothetical protein L208DRAFT_1383026 [Tricholoma matsutake 945]
MGIPGLWDILRPAEKIISFTEFTVKNSFEANGWGTHSFVIGVDASIWMSQTQAVFNHRGLHAQAGRSPELCILYYRLAWLLKLPVTAIFIFDSPKRPPIECGNPNMKLDGNSVALYALGDHPHVSLMEGGLLLIGLLISGDYDVDYIAVGLCLAHSRLRDSLLQAAHSSGPHQLARFLVQWRLKLQEELMTNPSGHLARKQPALPGKCLQPSQTRLSSSSMQIHHLSSMVHSPLLTFFGLSVHVMVLLGWWASQATALS